MNLLQTAKITTLAALLAVANISCAAEPVKPYSTATPTSTQPDTGKDQPVIGVKLPPQVSSFKIKEDGTFIPLNKDGREMKSCGSLEKNTCAIFNKKVTLGDVNFTMIGKIDYSVNPQCQAWIVVNRGVATIHYDHSNPECAKFNQ